MNQRKSDRLFAGMTVVVMLSGLVFAVMLGLGGGWLVAQMIQRVYQLF